MSRISEEIRHVMLFHYRKSYNASQTCREICAVYGENALNGRTVRNWFERFRGGNLDVKDLPRSSRPLTEKADEILQLIAIDRHASCQDITDALGTNHQMVWNHLKRLDIQKNSIFGCNEMEPFLKRLITGGEKWIKYENVKRKRSWSKWGEVTQTSLMEKNCPTKEQPKTMSPSFSPLNHRSSIPMEL